MLLLCKSLQCIRVIALSPLWKDPVFGLLCNGFLHRHLNWIKASDHTINNTHTHTHTLRPACDLAFQRALFQHCHGLILMFIILGREQNPPSLLTLGFTFQHHCVQSVIWSLWQPLLSRSCSAAREEGEIKPENKLHGNAVIHQNMNPKCLFRAFLWL